jgi:hypothetical protein
MAMSRASRPITFAQNILMMHVSLLGRQGFPWDVICGSLNHCSSPYIIKIFLYSLCLGIPLQAKCKALRIIPRVEIFLMSLISICIGWLNAQFSFPYHVPIPNDQILLMSMISSIWGEGYKLGIYILGIGTHFTTHTHSYSACAFLQFNFWWNWHIHNMCCLTWL